MDLSQIDPPPSPEIFWGEIAPCEHLVQFYDGDSAFMDSLEGFVSGGVAKGEAVVVIATAAHRAVLSDRLGLRGIDVDAARQEGRYTDLDAAETLARFIVGEGKAAQLDELRFQIVVTNLLVHASQGGRKVRVFGEMVALMWAQGLADATVRLEHLWHRYCRERAFSLFCAYPQPGAEMANDLAMQEICSAHSRVINP